MSCGPLSVVVLDVEIEGGVAESVSEFDVGPAKRRRRGSWGVSKGGASFYGLVSEVVRIRGTAWHQSQHVT